jgi:hypothetical protein
MVEVRGGRRCAPAQLEATRRYDETVKAIQEKFEDRKEKLERGDELAPGVLKMVKVFVAVKRNCSRATRWPAVTATRASSAASCRSRTCRS